MNRYVNLLRVLPFGSSSDPGRLPVRAARHLRLHNRTACCVLSCLDYNKCTRAQTCTGTSRRVVVDDDGEPVQHGGIDTRSQDVCSAHRSFGSIECASLLAFSAGVIDSELGTYLFLRYPSSPHPSARRCSQSGWSYSARAVGAWNGPACAGCGHT